MDWTHEQIMHKLDIISKKVSSIESMLKKKKFDSEVVHAKWNINCDGYYPYCSNCKNEPESGKMTKWCPNCGAKMDLEENRYG